MSAPPKNIVTPAARIRPYLRAGSFGWRCPRHFVPGYDRTVPPGRNHSPVEGPRIKLALRVNPGLCFLVHQVSDLGSGAAANFDWMREAKRENTRGGL